MLQDTYHRKYYYLRLSITDRCNFKCSYCLPNGYQCHSKPNYLSLNEIALLVESFAELGIVKIRITGGEPTLRRDLPDIIEIIHQASGIEHIGLTSNGYRLTSKLPRLIQSGLTSLNLSVDSLNPASFAQITGRNQLDDVLKNIEVAKQHGLRCIKLNAVLLKQLNSHEFNQFLSFIKNEPITFRFIELMQTLNNQSYFNLHHFSATHLVTKLIAEGWSTINSPYYSGPAKEFTHPDYQGKIGFIMPYSDNFCLTCNRLRVSSEGQLHLCLFGESSADLRPYLRDNDKQGLKSILNQLVIKKRQGHELIVGNSGIRESLVSIGG